MQAVRKRLAECFFGMSSFREKKASANNGPLRQILIGHCLHRRYVCRR